MMAEPITLIPFQKENSYPLNSNVLVHRNQGFICTLRINGSIQNARLPSIVVMSTNGTTQIVRILKVVVGPSTTNTAFCDKEIERMLKEASESEPFARFPKPAEELPQKSINVPTNLIDIRYLVKEHDGCACNIM